MPRHSALFVARLAAIIAAVAASACSGNAGPEVITDTGLDHQSGTKVEVYETGGIAGFVTDWVVSKESGDFAFSRRHPCGTASCAPPTDSASGTLSRATVDSLFAVVARDTVGLSATDFGTTKNAADMITYSLRVAVSGTSTVNAMADDGTMPPAMHRVVDAVHGAISAARK